MIDATTEVRTLLTYGHFGEKYSAFVNHPDFAGAETALLALLATAWDEGKAAAPEDANPYE